MGAREAMVLPLQFPNQTRSNNFNSIIRDIAFTGVQKLCGPGISRFLPYILQFLDNLRLLFIFSYYKGQIDHFTLDLLKNSDT